MTARRRLKALEVKVGKRGCQRCDYPSRVPWDLLHRLPDDELDAVLSHSTARLKAGRPIGKARPSSSSSCRRCGAPGTAPPDLLDRLAPDDAQLVLDVEFRRLLAERGSSSQDNDKKDR